MSFQTENTKYIICPNCRHPVEDTYDLFRKDESEIEISCLECRTRIKAFRETVITYIYSSEIVEED